MRPGDRVTLAASIGSFSRGRDGGPLLTIPNGSTGTIVGVSGPFSVVVAFDALGAGVGVSIALRSLTLDARAHMPGDVAGVIPPATG